MRAFLQKLGYKFQRFMQGRYGQDEFSRFLLVVTLILIVVSAIFRKLWFLSILVWALIIYSFFRMFSKNLSARAKERNAYLNVRNKIVRKWNTLKSRWRDRKEYNYYTCPKCHATIRIRKPAKGKKILVTCPKCRESFQKKT